jgi:hypothetical protein
VAAMLSILVRYNWQQFSIVTSEIAGHDDFVQAVRDKVAALRTKKFKCVHYFLAAVKNAKWTVIQATIWQGKLTWVCMPGDVGRIFTHWVIVYIGQF